MHINNLTFTVVIPTFNSENFIYNSIKSCLEQTILPNEIIIIDDYSIDNTVKIINQFNSPLIKLYINEKNMGPSYSRNIGIKACKSDWILFLDSDDIFHYKKIEILSNIIKLNPNISAIAHSCVISRNQKSLNDIISSDIRIQLISNFKLLIKNYFVTPSLAISNKNNILFDEKMRYAEDHDFILNTSMKHNFYFIDINLCSINRAPLTKGGLSSNFNEMRIGEILMYKKYCINNKYFILFPFLISFSLMKHLLFLIKYIFFKKL